MPFPALLNFDLIKKGGKKEKREEKKEKKEKKRKEKKRKKKEIGVYLKQENDKFCNFYKNLPKSLNPITLS